MQINVDAVQSIMIEANPFARLTGAEVIVAEPGHVTLRLEPRENVHNPFGAIHAGALFTFGETAAASLVISSVELEGRTVLMKAGEISYRKIVQEPITIDETMDPERIQAINDAVGADGKHDFPVEVSMVNEAGDLLCHATYTCHVRQV